MSSNRALAFTLAAVVGAVVVAALILTRSPQVKPASAGGGEGGGEVVLAATPEAVVAVETPAASPTVVAAEAAEPVETMVEPVAEVGASYPGAEEPFLDVPQIRELVEQYGVEGAYRMLSEEHRYDLLDYLVDFDEMRAELEKLLALEGNTELRTFMLENAIPYGMFDDPGAEEVVDVELIEILKAEPSSEMAPMEWVRRMNLARLVEPGEALYWARQSEERYPGNTEIAVVAAEAVLCVHGTRGGISVSEVERAESMVMETLSGGNLGVINSDYRLRAYASLAHGSDPARVRAFWESQLEVESDPRIRGMLERLLTPP